MPHHTFNSQTMGNKGRRIVVLAQQFVRFISGWFQVSLLLIQIHLYLVKSYQTASKKSTGSAGLLTSPNRAIVQRTAAQLAWCHNITLVEKLGSLSPWQPSRETTPEILGSILVQIVLDAISNPLDRSIHTVARTAVECSRGTRLVFVGRHSILASPTQQEHQEEVHA